VSRAERESAARAAVAAERDAIHVDWQMKYDLQEQHVREMQAKLESVAPREQAVVHMQGAAPGGERTALSSVVAGLRGDGAFHDRQAQDVGRGMATEQELGSRARRSPAPVIDRLRSQYSAVLMSWSFGAWCRGCRPPQQATLPPAVVGDVATRTISELEQAREGLTQAERCATELRDLRRTVIRCEAESSEFESEARAARVAKSSLADLEQRLQSLQAAHAQERGGLQADLEEARGAASREQRAAEMLSKKEAAEAVVAARLRMEISEAAEPVVADKVQLRDNEAEAETLRSQLRLHNQTFQDEVSSLKASLAETRRLLEDAQSAKSFLSSQLANRDAQMRECEFSPTHTPKVAERTEPLALGDEARKLREELGSQRAETVQAKAALENVLQMMRQTLQRPLSPSRSPDNMIRHQQTSPSAWTPGDGGSRSFMGSSRVQHVVRVPSPPVVPAYSRTPPVPTQSSALFTMSPTSIPRNSSTPTQQWRQSSSVSLISRAFPNGRSSRGGSPADIRRHGGHEAQGGAARFMRSTEGFPTRTDVKPTTTTVGQWDSVLAVQRSRHEDELEDLRRVCRGYMAQAPPG